MALTISESHIIFSGRKKEVLINDLSNIFVRLRELHARNNRLSMLLELAVYMRQMRRLIVLDLRANPICSSPGYKEVVVNTFSMLLSLDDAELNPLKQVRF